jgi:ABC-type Fe3+-hydroxamate transport system substrate-binding protein
MHTYSDQMNRSIPLDGTPKRIVSLVPSQTELLYWLGLDEEVVGITKFCVYPGHWYRSKTRVGGTKMVKADIVASLRPDLIIANKEENVKEQVEQLEKIAPVWISDISTIDDACRMIISIGQLTGKEEKAGMLVGAIKNNFAELRSVRQQQTLRTAYLIWKDPYMTIGGDTFIHDMLEHCGFINVFADAVRYPSVTVEEIKKRNPALMLLSTEPYPFKQKHIAELSKELPRTKILLADGEIFSWYGSRMLEVLPYMKGLLKMVNGAL